MKTHLSLRTAKLAESVAFYRSLLNAEPLKHHEDYALFVTEQPALELALNRGFGAAGETVSHFGIAVESSDEVDQAIARLESSGISVDVERDQTCCYAKQNKVWATDPDGRRWEVYHVLEESQTRDGSASTCCTEDTCDTYADCCAN